MINSIRILNESPYYDMKRHALKTIGKVPDKKKEWDIEWIKKSIISRHSHIRCVFIEVEFTTTKAVRDQLLRSKHGFVEPFVTSQRPDRNDGQPRDQNALTTWIHVFNIEGLIKMAGDRLCTSTELETRSVIYELKHTMMRSHDFMIRTIGEMMIPKCGWYGVCNEFKERNCFGFEEDSLSIYQRILFFNGEDV